MKATKNQAAAVRSYLSTLGINISHVQALEVIARGEGHRSRHVKASEPAQPAVSQPLKATPLVDAFAKAIALCDGRGNLNGSGVQQLRAVFPELFTSDARAQEFIDDDTDESVHLHCELLRLANAIRAKYHAQGCTQAAQAEALRKLVNNCDNIFRDYRSAYTFLCDIDGFTGEAVRAKRCQVCDTALDSKGYCKDRTCVYSDWPQSIAASGIFELPTAEIERLTGVTKRVRDETEADRQASLAEHIKSEYFASGCQRSDLEDALTRLVTECHELFGSEDSAMGFLMEGSDSDKAEEIKAEYLDSDREAANEGLAVHQLMAQCSMLFPDAQKARDFLGTGAPAGLDVTHVVQVESEAFGNDVYEYDSEPELRAGLIRLMAKAVELNDGVERNYYVSEIDSDIEKNTPEYNEALQSRELEGQITAQGMVHYQGEEIGLIKDLTEDGLTLYSWIDENP